MLYSVELRSQSTDRETPILVTAKVRTFLEISKTTPPQTQKRRAKNRLSVQAITSIRENFRFYP